MYWAIGLDYSVYHSTDDRFGADDRLYESGNYFYSEDEAKQAAAKFHAAIAGADVIEWPSSEEISEKATEFGSKFAKDVEVVSYFACCAEMMASWLKSKIVK